MKHAAGALAVVLACLLAGCAASGSKSNQNAAEINAQLGLAYMQQGDDERAMEKLKHALTINPSHPGANHYIAEIYQRLGQNDEAEKHYRKALAGTPTEPMLLNNYGVFLCKQRRMNEAETQFLTAAKQPFYKTPEVAYSNAALCAAEDDPPKAERYLRTALNINPRMAGALYEMADLKFKQQEYLTARGFLQRYFEVAGVSPQSLWLGVRVERQLGDETTASKYAAQLKQKFPLAHETELMQGQTK